VQCDFIYTFVVVEAAPLHRSPLVLEDGGLLRQCSVDFERIILGELAVLFEDMVGTWEGVMEQIEDVPDDTPSLTLFSDGDLENFGGSRPENSSSPRNAALGSNLEDASDASEDQQRNLADAALVVPTTTRSSSTNNTGGRIDGLQPVGLDSSNTAGGGELQPVD
ncbi:unnamed protein product, partial [Amoebophrya sp. A120]